MIRLSWGRRSDTSGKFLSIFKDYPPSQKPGSFSIDGALEALQRGGSN
jgi:hypothetical protein